MIYIENKKRKMEKLKQQYPEADIIDITSGSPYKIAQYLSPFYPHGNIPIPFSDGMVATCVEAVWQGLKVFQNCDVDIDLFNNDTMKNLKRTVRRFGLPLGHRKGVYGKELLNYFDARMLIYLPTYKWVLDNVPCVHNLVMRIAERAKDHDIVFLDYNTNDNFRDISKPLSHAGLVKLYIEGNYPDDSTVYTPLSEQEMKQPKLRKRNRTQKKRKQIQDNQPTLF